MKLTHWIHAMRLRTLPAAGAPLILGGVLAYLDHGFSPLIMAYTVVSALAIQIGTNLANDYFDWKNGADTDKRLGPVRVTQAGLIRS
ncbi:1,4-dihydroxy-2-naphthoate polyprenyltransferase, partial [bacterium]|nr:1,4-dihydroxy-2-naphthoate polyprenyltransferase [bacterium]